MSPRERVRALLLNELEPICPSVTEGDLLFFGSRADVSSPLPRKYGVDISENTVYNIRDGVKLADCALFSDAWISEGFVNFLVSQDAFFELSKDLGKASGYPPDVIDLEPCGAAFVIARLYDIANERPDAPFALPEDEDARRAFRCAVFASTPASVSVALEATLKALSIDRRKRVIGRRAALIMAAAFENIKSE